MQTIKQFILNNVHILKTIEDKQLFLYLSLIAFFLIVLIMIIYFIGRKTGQLEILKNQDELVKLQRKDAVKRSKAVLNGQLREQIAPFLPNFPCNPDDVRFLGKPVDFVGFVGLTNKDTVEEVLFIEVKTGQSKLSNREKSIKECIQNKKVRYVEYHL